MPYHIYRYIQFDNTKIKKKPSPDAMVIKFKNMPTLFLNIWFQKYLSRSTQNMP